MSLLEDLGALARGLCPESCPRCGMLSSRDFCKDCRDDFARVPSPCPRCGLPEPCRNCPAFASDWQIDAVRAPFVYAAPLARYVQALKYAGQRRLGSALGRLIAIRSTKVDAIVAVPLHPRRLRVRGFNQADEIARPIARRLGVPLRSAGIRRRLDTRPQTELGRSERLANPVEAFEIRRRLDGLRVAVVDDVITTGATVNALAGALRAAGAGRVEAWAVARAVGPDARGR